MTNLDVVKKLIGNIRPIGMTEIDSDRLDNLKAMCELANGIISDISAVARDFRDDHQGSVKKCAQYAESFLTETIGIESEGL